MTFEMLGALEGSAAMRACACTRDGCSPPSALFLRRLLILLRVGMGQHLHWSPQEGLPSSLEQVKFAVAMLEVEEILGSGHAARVSGQLCLLGSNSAVCGVYARTSSALIRGVP